METMANSSKGDGIGGHSNIGEDGYGLIVVYHMLLNLDKIQNYIAVIASFSRYANRQIDFQNNKHFITPLLIPVDMLPFYMNNNER
jgi:hypothetical protein